MKITDNKKFGLKLLDYNGGQGTDVYKVGSTLFADKHVCSLKPDDFEGAEVELSKFKGPEVAKLRAELRARARFLRKVSKEILRDDRLARDLNISPQKIEKARGKR